ncbi:hypothetical protein T492DRAFT_1000059 [Pavlovales sp. CCMP2436]|nr:hypothetical protein T492DRAFT_1000059 [Pavlovales sp. CCMP2436]
MYLGGTCCCGYSAGSRSVRRQSTCHRKGYSLKGYSLKGYSLKGYSLKGYSLKGYSLTRGAQASEAD